MKAGMIGMGKLGLPVALAMETAGHDIMGHDVNTDLLDTYRAGEYPHLEHGMNGTSLEGMLEQSNLIRNLTTDLRELVEHSDIIFVAVPTPHAPEYEGITRLPEKRADFDYTFLTKVMAGLAETITEDKVVAIISTVLPGTIRKRILPICTNKMQVVYNPSFISMGNVLADFLAPEFVLFGSDDTNAMTFLNCFYTQIVPAGTPVIFGSMEEAEITKVLYNTFLSQKIVLANTVMEIAHKVGNCNTDNVSGTLSLANKRLWSKHYLRGGMGDGGQCHPRDNIALSYLAQQLDLSFDPFEATMLAREAQAEWLVSLMEQYKLPKVILGTAFKAGTNIETGSAALLCKRILEERGHNVLTHDPLVNGKGLIALSPAVFLIGANHSEFAHYTFPSDSVVIDPWRSIPNQDDITVVRVGDQRSS